MCGLGVIARARPLHPSSDLDDRLRTCESLLARRGPDAGRTQHLASGRATLIHRRLAIQDPSHAADQPLHADLPDGGTLWLVYNGELYNAPSLRARLESLGARFTTHSDTEVVLHAVRLLGFLPALDLFRGMFALVCLTIAPDGDLELDAAVDHAGMKPLAFHFSTAPAPTLTLASDCDALRALLPEKPELDQAALLRVLTLGYSPAPNTMWAGIRKLGPGQRLQWSTRQPAPLVATWWSPPEALAISSRPDHARDAEDLLTTVCADHLIGDVPVAMFLSAGIDSAAVALSLKRSGADMSRITALTLSTADTTDGGDESADAADLARRLGMPHRIIPFAAADLADNLRLAARLYDEPQGYTALLTAARIAAATRAAVPDAKVVLTGDGGDEAFAGYPWHALSSHPLALDASLTPDAAEHDRLAALVFTPDARGRDRIAANLAWSHRSIAHRYARRLFDGFHPAEAAALIGAPPTTLDNDLETWLANADRPALPWPRRAQRLDILGFCAGSITPKLDRAAMGVGLELRCPLLDRRVLDWSLALPIDPRERTPGASKPPLRDFLRQGVADGLVPDSILTRPKRGFSLRLPDLAALESLVPIIDASALVASGRLRADYQRFIPADPETRRARIALLANLAAWFEHRAGL